MEVPHQPAGVAAIECGLIAAGLVPWRAHPVRSTGLVIRRRSPQKSAGGHILRRVVALFRARWSASHGPSASNGNTQEERRQQRA
jgi:hypothetical protein